MAADVDADEFALAVELFQVAPAFKDHGGFGLADLHFFASAEERIGAFFAFHLEPLPVGEEGVEVGESALALSEELFAAQFTKAVEGAGKGEALEIFAVANVEIHALEEVEDGQVFAAAFALVDDRLYGIVTQALDARESETDIAEVVDRKFAEALVHVGTEAD